MLCTNCNTQNAERSQFCMSCGQRLEPPDNATRKLTETGSETVKLPETDASLYTPPPASPPPTYTPTPSYPPPANSPPPYYVPPGYTPPAYTPPGYSPPGVEPVAASRWKQLGAARSFKFALGGGFVLLLLLASGLLLAQYAPSLLPQGKEILLGAPQRSGDFDLYMVKVGQELDQGVLLVEDAQPADGDVRFYSINKPAYRTVNLTPTRFGGFVPNSNRLFYWYRDGDRVYVQEIRTNDDAPAEIMRTDALPLFGLLFPDTQELFLQETRNDQERCYAANPREAAERLTKGNNCWATVDGSYAWTQEGNADDYSLSLLPLNRKGEPVAVLDEQAEVGSFSVARDGSQVAYTQNSRDGWHLFLFTTNNGATIEVGQPGFNIAQFGFLGATERLFYIMENDEGVLQLFLSGSGTPVAEAVSLAAVASDDGHYLVYMTVDEDGEKTVASYDVNSGANQTILTADNLQFNALATQNVVLLQMQDGEDLFLYRANMDGSNLELLFEDDLALRSVQYAPDQDRLHVLVSDDKGYDSLFTTSLSEANGFYLLEDWYEITLLNRSVNGHSLVLAGQEDPGDDYILYSIALEKGADLVKLDDQYERYPNAVFTANSRDVIYTGVSGSSNDDVDVRQVPANGKKPPEVLYREAQLLDVRWDTLAPFQFIGYARIYESVSFCPGAQTLVVGEPQRDEMPEEGTICYRYRGQQDEMVTFDVDSTAGETYDFTLSLHDREGDRLNFNDDDEAGLDPRLTTLLPNTGSYFLVVGGNGRTLNPQYTLSVLEGPGEPAVTGASQLMPDNKVRAVIEEGSAVYLQRYNSDLHGHFYYFEATENDRITLNAYATSIGSDLDPEIHLFNQFMELISSDDDGGADYDSSLVFTTEYTGRYYVLVTSSAGNDYGNDLFYEIEMTVR